VFQVLGDYAKRGIVGSDSTGRLIAIWPWIRFMFPNLSGFNELVDSKKGLEDFVRDSYYRHQKDFDPEVLRDITDFYLQKKDLFEGWTGKTEYPFLE